MGSKYFREKHGIAKSIDADEITRNQIELKREEIKQKFESEMAREVKEFWTENQESKESKQGKRENYTIIMINIFQ